MRVIAGTRRHMILKTVDDMSIRPTQDRTKETLFNVLSPNIYDASFLDLFSGSGAIGIEALSRGAEPVVMVEKLSTSLQCIKENLKATKLIDDARLMAMDVFDAIPALEREKKVFDIIFMDPPFDKGIEKQVIERLSNSSLVGSDTIIVCEASIDTDFSYIDECGFDFIKEKRYKNNKHVFFKKKES